MNIFNNHEPPSLLKTLIYSATPTITVETPPYFHIRSEREFKQNPLYHEPFKNTTSSITDARFAELRLNNFDPTVLASLEAEKQFLISIGIAYQTGDTLYISEHAELLYKPGGVFDRYTTAATPDEKFSALKPYTELLIYYILPGLYWRSYYAYIGLSHKTGIAHTLQQQMTGIAETWASIKNEYDSSTL
jgi:hypothetical protein